MIGKEIGNYKVLKELGRGGMGVVYKAHQVTLGRMVAMKVLPHHLTSDTAFIKRFENEARAIAKLNHPNIVQIYDIGHESDIHYYTMEFLEGPSLDQVIYREGFLPLDRALNIVLQAARALQYAHSEGIIHRDIKPSNIIIDRSSRAKLTDFGLALQERTTRLTVDGSIVGTPEYMSPEQAAAEPATVRSDIYSLGVVFYELITGKIPFEGETALLILKKIQSLEPQWPRSLNPQIPLEVERVIQRMMAKKPRDRYPNCQELIRDLRRLKEGQPIPLKRRRPVGKMAAAAAAGLLIAGSIIFVRLYQKEPAETPPPDVLALEKPLPVKSPDAPPPLPPPSLTAVEENAAPAPLSPEEELAQVERQMENMEAQLEEVRSSRVSADDLLADTLIFKKGNRIKCNVLGENLEKVRIKTASGLAEIPREEVNLIVYASPEEKQSAEHACRLEEERLQQEQQLRDRIEELQEEKNRVARLLQPAAQPPPKIQLAAAPAAGPQRSSVNAPSEENEHRSEERTSREFRESVSLPLREGKWTVKSSCGVNKGVQFQKDFISVSTSQTPATVPCSVVVEISEPLDGYLHSIEVLVEIKRLIVASDQVSASLAATFADGSSVEYVFFDSSRPQLSVETRQTPERIFISRPENTIFLDEGWQTLRLPVVEDSAKIKTGEKLARISLHHNQSSGGGVFLFRYKAIILNMM